jgi:hypothetical protein
MKRTRPTSLLQSVALILVFVTFCNSQSLDELIRGPLLGFTYTPEVGKFDISASYVNVNANSLYDGDGKEMTYNDVFDGYADPEVSFSGMYLRGEYAFTNALSFGIAVPFILDQKIEYNPASGYESFFENESGETGLGDITISAWYQLLKNEKMTLQGALGYQLATGSSPEDVGENNFSSTGSGHTAIDGGLNIDILVASKILVSGYGNYTINQEASFSSDGYSWDEKSGNVLMIGGRASMSASPQLSLGLHFDMYVSGESEVDGENIDDSESKFARLTPMLGYKLQTPEYTAHIAGGYMLPLGGENFPKRSGIDISITAFF